MRFLRKRWKTVLFILILAGFLVVLKDARQDFLSYFQSFNRWIFLESVVVVVITFALFSILSKWKSPVFEHKLPWDFSTESMLDFSVWGWLLITLFFLNIPFVAKMEELIFRGDLFGRGTAGWEEGVWRSILFGFVHYVFGVHVKTAILIVFLGLWFTWHYLHGGVPESTLYHATFNFAALAIWFFSFLGKGNK